MKQVTLKEIYQKLIAIEASVKKFEKVDKYIEDLEFARRAEDAYQRHESGDFIKMDSKEFLKELKKW